MPIHWDSYLENYDNEKDMSALEPLHQHVGCFAPISGRGREGCLRKTEWGPDTFQKCFMVNSAQFLSL